MGEFFVARRAQIIDGRAPRKPRYIRRGGKIYDADVEISADEARATIQRNALRRKQNAEQLRRAGSTDLGKVMAQAAALASSKFDEEDEDLRRALGEE